MQIKTAAFTLAAALFVLSYGAVVAAPGEPTEPTPTGPNQPPGAKDNFDPIYNVCRGTDPRCYHPWVADRQNKVLLYTRTAGPRHANTRAGTAGRVEPAVDARTHRAERDHQLDGRGRRRGPLDRGCHSAHPAPVQ